MIESLENKLQDEDLLNAPKVLRTHCYVQQPHVYGIGCLICASCNITWSEFEGHIWCYHCEKDVLLIHRYAGIFGGPIPMGLCESMGTSFDRINIKKGKVMKCNIGDDTYNSTWVIDDKLIAYEKKINEKLDKDG